jgi:hypothetical protein
MLEMEKPFLLAVYAPHSNEACSLSPTNTKPEFDE